MGDSSQFCLKGYPGRIPLTLSGRTTAQKKLPMDGGNLKQKERRQHEIKLRETSEI